MIRITLLFGICFMTASCTPALLEQMGRSRENPQITAPRVSSFSEPGVIIISWDKDFCADEYLLVKALDSDRQFSPVYRGRELFYRDDKVLSEVRYLYALYKIRGTKYFGPSPNIMGVGAQTQEDIYEQNNFSENATPFTHDIMANTYGYKSIGHEYTLIDRDYYAVTIRPHMTASYMLNVAGVSGNTPTGLEYQIKYREPADVVDMAGISFENNSSFSITITFALYPKDSEISQNATEGGGRFFTYELCYIGEVPASGGGL